MEIINNIYKLKQIVFLVTDPDQLERMVISINLGFNRVITYTLSCGVEETDHYEEEISPERDIVKAMQNNNGGED